MRRSMREGGWSAAESFFSGLKRTIGSTLISRKPNQLLVEAAFKVLAYTLQC